MWAHNPDAYLWADNGLFVAFGHESGKCIVNFYCFNNKDGLKSVDKDVGMASPSDGPLYHPNVHPMFDENGKNGWAKNVTILDYFHGTTQHGGYTFQITNTTGTIKCTYEGKNVEFKLWYPPANWKSRFVGVD